MNDVPAVSTVDAALAVDEDKVQVGSNPETECAGIVWESELARIANAPGFDDTESDGIDEGPEAEETVVADWAPSAVDMDAVSQAVLL
ncbi:unnamed protein product, partial [Laminaria digitata]